MTLKHLHTIMNPKSIDSPPSKGIVGFLAAAVTTAVASSLCCIAPLIYLIFGVSAASLSGLSKLTWLQWPMLVLSIGFMVTITYRLFFSKKPICSMIQRKYLVILYFIFLPFVIFMLTYPFVLPWLLELFE